MVTVLLIEDDKDSADPIAIILRKRSHRVSVAVNGEQALKLLLDGLRPDVVIVDLQMPVMDGITFLDNFRSFERYRSTPVVVISALSPFAEDELRPYGVAAALTKGRVDLVALAESIDRLDPMHRISISLGSAAPEAAPSVAAPRRRTD